MTNNVAWIYLILAGLAEIGWPLGLKISQSSGKQIAGIALAVISMSASGALLWLAQRSIPIGTAYAIWTGIGATGTFLVGIVVYGDSANVFRMFSAAFIVAGIVGLKLSHDPKPDASMVANGSALIERRDSAVKAPTDPR